MYQPWRISLNGSNESASNWYITTREQRDYVHLLQNSTVLSSRYLLYMLFSISERVNQGELAMRRNGSDRRRESACKKAWDFLNQYHWLNIAFYVTLDVAIDQTLHFMLRLMWPLTTSWCQGPYLSTPPSTSYPTGAWWPGQIRPLVPTRGRFSFYLGKCGRNNGNINHEYPYKTQLKHVFVINLCYQFQVDAFFIRWVRCRACVMTSQWLMNINKVQPPQTSTWTRLSNANISQVWTKLFWHSKMSECYLQYAF